MKASNEEVYDMKSGHMAAGTAKRQRLAAQELATWQSLLDTTDELRRVLGTQLQASGLSPGDYQVLLALRETEGQQLRSSELAASIDWERSRLSHHLGRMERRGLIRRDDCPTDSRGAEVSLTERGTEAFRRASAPHLRAIKQHFVDALTSEQLEALAEVLQALQRHLQGDVSAGRTGGTHR